MYTLYKYICFVAIMQICQAPHHPAAISCIFTLIDGEFTQQVYTPLKSAPRSQMHEISARVLPIGRTSAH